jgi:signal transduction histidine kinase
MHRSRLSALTPLVYLVVGLALLASGMGWRLSSPLTGDTSLSPWRHLLPLLVACAGIVLQRRHVMSGFALASVAAAADTALGLHVAVFLAWADTAYTVARRAEPRRRGLALGLTGLAVLMLCTIMAASPGGDEFALPLGLTLTAGVAVPFWWGAEVRTGDDRAARAGAAAQLERERSESARREAERGLAEAVQRERTAMARELHDTVSAHLSGIALHSAAALSGAPDAELDRRALRHTRSASLAALEEMRTMIGLLHQPGDPLDLQVRDGLDALPALVRRNRDAGLALTAELEPVDVTPAGGQALLRVAQEGLANAARHGMGSAVMRLEARADVIRLDIDNPVLPAAPGTGPDGGPSGRSAGSGIGLASMTERMRSVGGTLDVAHDAGRWRVRAEVPVREGLEEEA